MAAPTEVAFSSLLFGGIGFMLLAAAMVVFFLVTYQKRLLRQEQQLRATEAAHQRQLLTAVIEAQEGERERIGRDLHDSVGSTVSTAKLLVSRLSRLSPGEDSAEVLGLLKDVMGTVVQDVRSISHSLYPDVLARFGLAEALQHLINVYNEAGTLPITLVVVYPHPLTLAQELALYRICQELIHNALKHATGATQIDVRLQQQATRLSLTVEDDGCGFSDTIQAAAKGVGLRSVDVRVKMLQARLQRQSTPGHGSCTRIELDLSAIHDMTPEHHL